MRPLAPARDIPRDTIDRLAVFLDLRSQGQATRPLQVVKPFVILDPLPALKVVH